MEFLIELALELLFTLLAPTLEVVGYAIYQWLTEPYRSRKQAHPVVAWSALAVVGTGLGFLSHPRAAPTTPTS